MLLLKGNNSIGKKIKQEKVKISKREEINMYYKRYKRAMNRDPVMEASKIAEKKLDKGIEKSRERAKRIY